MSPGGATTENQRVKSMYGTMHRRQEQSPTNKTIAVTTAPKVDKAVATDKEKERPGKDSSTAVNIVEAFLSKSSSFLPRPLSQGTWLVR